MRFTAPSLNQKNTNVNFSRGPNPVAELVSHLALSANGIARTWQTVIRAIAAPIQICPIQ
jgi:hypothetical protein